MKKLTFLAALLLCSSVVSAADNDGVGSPLIDPNLLCSWFGIACETEEADNDGVGGDDADNDGVGSPSSSRAQSANGVVLVPVQQSDDTGASDPNG